MKSAFIIFLLLKQCSENAILGQLSSIKIPFSWTWIPFSFFFQWDRGTAAATNLVPLQWELQAFVYQQLSVWELKTFLSNPNWYFGGTEGILLSLLAQEIQITWDSCPKLSCPPRGLSLGTWLQLKIVSDTVISKLLLCELCTLTRRSREDCSYCNATPRNISTLSLSQGTP